MFSQDDDGQQGLVLGVVFGLLALVIALVISVSIYKRNLTDSSPKNTPAKALSAGATLGAPTTATPVAAANAQAALDAASITVEYGVVKFYFASGKADLAAGASQALVGVIKAAHAGRKVVISGFHDASGSAVKNAELARQRAVAVRDALKAAGVPDEKIDLKKPEQVPVTGSTATPSGNGTSSTNDAQARRVEVTLQ